MDGARQLSSPQPINGISSDNGPSFDDVRQLSTSQPISGGSGGGISVKGGGGARHLWCTDALCAKAAVAAERAGELPYQSDVAAGRPGRGYVYWNKTDFSEELFSRAMWEGPAAVESIDLAVVTTTYKNPPRNALDFINVQPFPTFVSTKEPGLGIHSEPWGNVGQEIPTYTRFILMFWDHLPERMAFLHGHDRAWHQEAYNMHYTLRNLCYKKYEYASLNAFHPVKGPNPKYKPYWKIVTSNWKLVAPWLGKNPPKGGFMDKCCAQFVVTRERVKKRPKAFYEMVLATMTDPKKNYMRAADGKNWGWDLIHFWEAIWHFIFGEPAWVNVEKKYGKGIQKNIYTGAPLSRLPDRSLRNLVKCPQTQCEAKSPMCRESIECMKKQPRAGAGGKGPRGRMCWPDMLAKSEKYRIETLTSLGVINSNGTATMTPRSGVQSGRYPFQ